ncbi:MAG: type IVB secretion system protein IcmH/DotU [Bacteroidota bacterium]
MFSASRPAPPPDPYASAPPAAHAQGMRLAELYAPSFALIIQLRSTDQFGEVRVLRERIKSLLTEASRRGYEAGHGQHALSEAQFAIVAFLDEAVFSSGWAYRNEWVTHPLQLEYYDRYDAGEVFFDKLSTYLAQPAMHAEVLEVYYLCLVLGFKGRYHLHDQEELRQLIEHVYHSLARVPGVTPETLAPHALPVEQVAGETRQRLPSWFIAALVGTFLLLLYLGASLYASINASEAAERISELSTTAAVAPPR